MSTDHSTSRTKPASDLKPVTKLAFIAVVVVFLLGGLKLWTESFMSQEPQDAVTVVENERTTTFAAILPKLYPNTFFGRDEKADGYYVTVVGYVGEEGTIEADGGARDKLSIYVLGSEEEYPLYLLLGEDDETVPIVKKGTVTATTVKKMRRSLKKGQPVALTVYFDDEFYYLTAIMALEKLSDHITIGLSEPILDVLFDTKSVVSLEIL